MKQFVFLGSDSEMEAVCPGILKRLIGYRGYLIMGQTGWMGHFCNWESQKILFQLGNCPILFTLKGLIYKRNWLPLSCSLVTSTHALLKLDAFVGSLCFQRWLYSFPTLCVIPPQLKKAPDRRSVPWFTEIVSALAMIKPFSVGNHIIGKACNSCMVQPHLVPLNAQLYETFPPTLLSMKALAVMRDHEHYV